MLEFKAAGESGWRATAGRVAIFVDDRNGAPDSAQADLANKLAANLDALAKQGAHYLDMFTDRAKICGRTDEPWWFDEIDMRGLKPGACLLSFTLEGDDGGLWTVEFVDRHEQFWPVRFERRQG